jgi:hypothetical protein
MFVLSEDPPGVNKCVDIVLMAAGSNVPAVRFPGMVIHHSNDGFGVLFRQLGSDARTFVAKCLR